ncbi:hypothetical protein JMJ35_006217 [Cladonia borealis]|uniref:Uncharacterized protein n=1 Tax=Cladonia borealis TaxID=184061 RepID=A0AA39R0K4_9LECA|nr:hypothetical protein JMJ35_006217 [Cladonia borealis]
MYFLSHALPLTALFSTIALVSAIPQEPSTPVPLVPASQPTNATNPVDPRVCVGNNRPYPFTTRYLVLRMCLDAISQLPEGNQVATFRDFDPGDDFYLPQTRKAQTCQVTVSLPYGYNTETTSWAELKMEANYLAEKCCTLQLSNSAVLALEGKNNKGAYVPTGQHGRMRINLSYVSPEAEAEGNITSALAIAGKATNIPADAVLAA